MNATLPRLLTCIALAATSVGCGIDAKPIRPVVKQTIPADKRLKKIDLTDSAKSTAGELTTPSKE
jgi:hypothetical protein